MHCLAGMVKFSDKFLDFIGFIKESDFFHPTHQVIFKIVKQNILDNKILHKATISSQLNQLGISAFDDDVDIEDYIGSLYTLAVSREGMKDLFKELKSYMVRRGINELAKNLGNISNKKSENIQDLINDCDSAYGKTIKELISLGDNEDQIDLFKTIKDVIEDIAANPPDPTIFPLGPYATVNTLYGSLHRPHNITMVVAATATGKTNFSMCYNLWMAEKYGWPILWQDFGEMSGLELQLRAAATLSNSRVPMDMIEDGSWAQNSTYAKEIRAVWPRVAKMKLYYEDISRSKPLDIFSSVRKFYYNKIGRGNKFLWCYDYLKPFDTEDKYNKEYEVMGKFIQDCKSFIKQEVPVSLFTSIQANRGGITNNKLSNQIDDSENIVSMSKRITDQTSHSFILRHKTNDEIEYEEGDFGNMMLVPIKLRHRGKEPRRSLSRVRMPSGKYRTNYINLECEGFFFEDKGDLQDMADILNDKYAQENAENWEEPTGDLL